MDQFEPHKIVNNGFDRIDEVSLVTFHFNPCRFRRIRETYYEWLPTLGPLSSALTCYELVFDDDKPEIEGSVIIRGTRELNGMWQKEALVNVALRETNPNVKYFGWVDHDIVIEDQNWLSDAVSQIDQGCVAVQLFKTLTYLDSRRIKIINANGIGPNGRGCPGGAWLAERRFMDEIGGLNIDNICGGSDEIFADCLRGIHSHQINQFGPALQNSMRQWIDLSHDKVKNRRFGFVNSAAYHLWHGDQKHRQYAKRHKMLIKHEFDPTVDIRIGSNGLIEWASDKPCLKQDMFNYFAMRKEDY